MTDEHGVEDGVTFERVFESKVLWYHVRRQHGRWFLLVAPTKPLRPLLTPLPAWSAPDFCEPKTDPDAAIEIAEDMVNAWGRAVALFGDQVDADIERDRVIK